MKKRPASPDTGQFPGKPIMF